MFKNVLKGAKHPIARILGYAANWVIDIMDAVFQFIVVNAFVVVAMDGTPFYKSGKKAVNLVKTNFKDVVKLCHIGNVVLLIGNAIIVLTAWLISSQLISVRCKRFFFNLFL